ncbi:unnamed protein product [Prunus armeniaca]|uniref:Uncharacterized protein n=1 Tax=Prunus armeniaca TaxID=36596 RepID=A0A6J5X9A1_PRUAR|nr:unnamed protein product [Prunus armeniaca]
MSTVSSNLGYDGEGILGLSDAVQLEFAENWDWNNKIQAKREALTANSMVFNSNLDYKSCQNHI